jgi:hypothetical protein
MRGLELAFKSFAESSSFYDEVRIICEDPVNSHRFQSRDIVRVVYCIDEYFETTLMCVCYEFCSHEINVGVYGIGGQLPGKFFISSVATAYDDADLYVRVEFLNLYQLAVTEGG